MCIRDSLQGEGRRAGGAPGIPGRQIQRDEARGQRPRLGSGVGDVSPRGPEAVDVDEGDGIPDLTSAAEDGNVRGAVDEGDPSSAGRPGQAVRTEGEWADAAGVAFGREAGGLGVRDVVARQRACAYPPHGGRVRQPRPRDRCV